MTFHYDVMTKDEATRERFSLLPDGQYDAVIKTVKDRVSSNGNPMFDMTVSVYDKNGSQIDIRDFLVFNRKMMWKVIHCAEAAKVLKEYENKQFAPHLLANKNVKVFIQTQKGNLIPHDKLQGKQPGACYPDKNIISDYIGTDQLMASATTAMKAEDLLDDAIPF